VRHEDVAQAVSMLAAERPHRVCEVDDPSARCVDIEACCVDTKESR
jgi:hypothetical protein